MDSHLWQLQRKHLRAKGRISKYPTTSASFCVQVLHFVSHSAAFPSQHSCWLPSAGQFWFCLSRHLSLRACAKWHLVGSSVLSLLRVCSFSTYSITSAYKGLVKEIQNKTKIHSPVKKLIVQPEWRLKYASITTVKNPFTQQSLFI